ncbi:MAG: hypothetical protein NC078_08440, partial [Ruminococcus sp.]|nr:hypothetical protein [Ruminococcus sp.]
FMKGGVFMKRRELKPETIETIGKIVSLVGVAATLVADWANKRTMDETIRKEVVKAVKEHGRH